MHACPGVNCIPVFHAYSIDWNARFDCVDGIINNMSWLLCPNEGSHDMARKSRNTQSQGTGRGQSQGTGSPEIRIAISAEPTSTVRQGYHVDVTPADWRGSLTGTTDVRSSN